MKDSWDSDDDDLDLQVIVKKDSPTVTIIDPATNSFSSNAKAAGVTPRQRSSSFSEDWYEVDEFLGVECAKTNCSMCRYCLNKIAKDGLRIKFDRRYTYEAWLYLKRIFSARLRMVPNWVEIIRLKNSVKPSWMHKSWRVEVCHKPLSLWIKGQTKLGPPMCMSTEEERLCTWEITCTPEIRSSSLPGYLGHCQMRHGRECHVCPVCPCASTWSDQGQRSSNFGHNRAWHYCPSTKFRWRMMSAKTCTNIWMEPLLLSTKTSSRGAAFSYTAF